jgi:AraC family transcriptional regulator
MFNERTYHSDQANGCVYSAQQEEKPLKQLSLCRDELVFEHCNQQPGQFASPSLAYHLLEFQLCDIQQVLQVNQRSRSGRLPSGSFFLIPAGSKVSYCWSTSNESLKIKIQPVFLQTLASEIGYPTGIEIELMDTLFSVDTQIQSMMQFCMAEIHQDKIGNQPYLESLMMLLGIHLLRYYSTDDVDSSDLLNRRNLSEQVAHQAQLLPNAIIAVLEYVQNHLDQDLGLSILAKQANLSTGYLSQLFKQSMGCSPHQYVIEQRLNRVKFLLIQTNDTIAKIASQAGFQDQSHLSKVFRQHIGMTPYQYRGKQSKKD